jgi:hypothetical protein
MILFGLNLPPEISVTTPVSDSYERFREEDSLISSASFGGFVDGPLPLRFIEVSEPPSEALFTRLAAEDPERLLAALRGLAPHDLTFAAEALGAMADTSRAQAALLQLLRHESALVREGAVYGAAKLLPSASLEVVLEEISKRDPSNGVRTAAADVLS